MLAGGVVQVGTHPAYQLLVAGLAITTAVSAVFLILLPPVTPVPVDRGPRWIALRDRPYLLLTALDGVRRRLPRLVFADLAVLGVPAWAAATLLLTAVVVHAVGELWHAAPACSSGCASPGGGRGGTSSGHCSP